MDLKRPPDAAREEGYGGIDAEKRAAMSAQTSRYSAGMGSVHEPLLYEDCPMSKDRRQFLIVCVFDSVLTTMLWLLSTVTKGDDWPTIFFNEVNIFEPNFLKISLFDLVMVGCLRTAVLLVFYAGLRVEHWLPVAATTTITTGFIVVKILFFFKKDHGALPQYLVLLASFSVAWFELWLVPFRVLPGERRHDPVLLEAEAAGWPRPSAAPRRHQRASVLSRPYPTTTDDEFRSALEYTTDEERLPRLTPDVQVPGFGPIPRQDALARLDQASQRLAQLLNEAPLWKALRVAAPLIRNRDNLFYMRAQFRGAPRPLFLAAWRDNARWNPQVRRVDLLVRMDNNTDIVHSETTPALGGYISARHFVDIRRVVVDEHSQVYTGIYTSIPTQLHPEQSQGGVRGFNHANMVRIQPAAGDADSSVFEWIMDTDVKSQVPRGLLKRGTASFLATYPGLLAKYVEEHATQYAEEA